jgi:hypothetical protein
MNKLTKENQARLSLVAALCEDMKDIGDNNDQEIYFALQSYLDRRWRPRADALIIDQK